MVIRVGNSLVIERRTIRREGCKPEELIKEVLS